MRNDDDDDDEIDAADDRPKHELYDWLPPAEQQAALAEAAERSKRLKDAELMGWCRQRAEAREAETSRRREVPYDGAGQPLPVVMKDYGAPVTRRAAAAAPASLTTEWQQYIERRIKRELQLAQNAQIKAAGETFIKDIVAVERSNAELRDRVQHLENEVADLFRMTRAQARDAEVAERFKQYDELQDRLARLESGGRPLKVVG